jgi:hypothetical protein
MCLTLTLQRQRDPSNMICRYPFLVLRMAESLAMSVMQPLFSIWRLRVLYRALFVVGIAHQLSLGYDSLSVMIVCASQLISLRILTLGLMTYIPALLGHTTFAGNNPWFWKHIGSQFAMGLASPFLSAWALVTLQDVSRSNVHISGLDACGSVYSLTHLNCRPVGDLDKRDNGSGRA